MVRPRAYIRYWLKRWAHSERERSLRHLRRVLGALSPVEASRQVFDCVRHSYDADIIEMTPVLLWNVYEWRKKMPNRTHQQVWCTLRQFIRRRLAHHDPQVREAGWGAADNAFCYTTADRRRLFLQNILHPQEEVWLTIIDWAEYVAWRDLISLLLRETPWRSGTAWNVLFAIDNVVIDRMDEAQKTALLGALKTVLLYVDKLCLVRSVDRMALWKICETVGFHIQGIDAKRTLLEVATRCRSEVVRQECRSAVRDYFKQAHHVERSEQSSA